MEKVDGLDHIIGHAVAVAPLFGCEIVPGRHEEDGNIFIEGTDRLDKFKAVDLGHHDIRHDQIKYRLVHGIVGIRGPQTARGPVAAVIEVRTDRAV